MALNDTQKQNIYKASFDGASSFVPDLTKIAAQEEPMIVVGLGGTGIDALLRVKKKVSETFITEEGRRLVPKNIAFYGVDTDASSFRPVKDANGKIVAKQKSYMGVKLEQGEYLDIAVPDINERLRRKHLLGEYVKEWLDPELEFNADAGAGAGGIRQISRFSLFVHSDEFIQDMQRIIRPMTTNVGVNTDKIRIFVLFGVSGGTGSGTFLDVAYLLQHAICELYPDRDFSSVASSMAYLFTPDISWINCQKPYIRTNGYAALKELDYLMNLPVNKDTFHQQYSLHTTVSPTTEPPFNQVHLLSASFADGGHIEDPYERTMQIAAEHIISFMSADNNAEGANTSMLTPRGYLVNVPQMVNGMITKLDNQDKHETVGYTYTILGCDCKALPVKDIMLCLASELFKQIDAMMNNSDPQERQISTSMSTAYTGINLTGLDNEIQKGITPFSSLKNNPNLSMSQVLDRNAGVNVYAYYENLLAANIAIIQTNASDDRLDAKKVDILQALGRFFSNKAAAILTDPKIPQVQMTEFGPAWTNNLTIELRAEIEKKYNELGTSIMQIESQLLNEATLRQQLELKRQEAAKSLFHKADLYNAYMNGLETLYGYKLNLERMKIERGVLANLHGYLGEQNQKIFETVKDVLVAFAKVFDDSMALAGNIDLRKHAEGSVVLNWNLLNITNVNDQILAMIRNNGINMTEVANRLYENIWSNIGMWTEKENGFKACESLRDFIAKEFNALLEKSIEDYLKEEYQRDPCGHNSFDEYLKEHVAAEMARRSNMAFNAGAAYQSLSSIIPKNDRVLIPRACTTISNAFSNVSGSVGVTNLKTKINWLSSAHGLPLYTYAEIQILEDGYEEMLGSDGKGGDTTTNGYHLYMVKSSDRDWRELPSIVPASQRAVQKPTASELRRRTHYGEIFDEAVRFGIIRQNTNKVYECVFAGNFEADALVASCRKEDGTYDKKELEAAMAEIENYLRPDVELPYLDEDMERNEVVSLYGGKTLAKVRKWYQICYGLNKRVEKEVEKYRVLEAAKAKCAEELDKINASHDWIAELRKMIGQFARARMTGLICNKGPKYLVKIKDEDEGWLVASRSDISDSGLGDYKEYALFDLLFLHRDKTQVKDAVFRKVSELANTRFDNLDDDYDEVVEKYREVIGDEAETIAYRYDEIHDGATIKQFYDIITEYMRGL